MEKAHNLRDVVDGVPNIMNPIYWDAQRKVGDNLNTVEIWMGSYTAQGLVPRGGQIDEAAVLVPSRWHATRFINNLEVEGWEHFNGAEDLVYTNPFGTRYLVRYEFLRSPQKTYRLEVMYLQPDSESYQGFSPLHSALWVPEGLTPGTSGTVRFPIAHLSFKAPKNTGDLQLRSAYSRAVAHLQAKGCIHAQTCQSTYGVFGYYLPHDATRQLYLKPRVNLRDDA